MSTIATSALVAPSRRLRLALAIHALAHLGAACMCAFLVPERLQFRLPCALFFLAAALFSLHGCTRLTKTHRIDVSGTGALRLTVQQKLGTGPAAATDIAVSLLPGSLLWPQLMLLRLGDAAGAIYALPVLRDSLGPDEYRSLRVALGALDGRTARAAQETKIL